MTNICIAKLIIHRIKYYDIVIYGSIIDSTKDKTDILLSNPINIDHEMMKCDDIMPVTPNGKLIYETLSNLDTWDYNRLKVVSVYNSNILKKYIFNKNINSIRIKDYFSIIFKNLIPRYIENVIFDEAQSVKLDLKFNKNDEHYSIDEYTIDNNESTNCIFVNEKFKGYTSKHKILKTDIYDDVEIYYDNRKYNDIDLYKYMDCLYVNDKTPNKYVPQKGHIIMGTIKKNKNNKYFYTNWFYITPQFLEFLIFIYNKPDTLLYKESDIIKYSNLFILPKLNGNIDSYNLETYNMIIKHYPSYINNKCDNDLFNLLYICSNYNNIIELYDNLYNTLSDSKKNILNHIFRILRGN